MSGQILFTRKVTRPIVVKISNSSLAKKTDDLSSRQNKRRMEEDSPSSDTNGPSNTPNSSNGLVKKKRPYLLKITPDGRKIIMQSKEEKEKETKRMAVPSFPCRFCEKIFVRHKDLDEHGKAGRKCRFSCIHCGNEFSFRTNLKRHIARTHTHRIGSKICNICGKRLASKSLLQQHAKEHEKKKFYCQLCNEHMKSEFVFKMHNMQRHGGPFFEGCRKKEIAKSLKTAEEVEKNRGARNQDAYEVLSDVCKERPFKVKKVGENAWGLSPIRLQCLLKADSPIFLKDHYQTENRLPIVSALIVTSSMPSSFLIDEIHHFAQFSGSSTWMHKNQTWDPDLKTTILQILDSWTKQFELMEHFIDALSSFLKCNGLTAQIQSFSLWMNIMMTIENVQLKCSMMSQRYNRPFLAIKLSASVLSQYTYRCQSINKVKMILNTLSSLLGKRDLELKPGADHLYFTSPTTVVDPLKQELTPGDFVEIGTNLYTELQKILTSGCSGLYLLTEIYWEKFGELEKELEEMCGSGKCVSLMHKQMVDVVQAQSGIFIFSIFLNTVGPQVRWRIGVQVGSSSAMILMKTCRNLSVLGGFPKDLIKCLNHFFEKTKISQPTDEPKQKTVVRIKEEPVWMQKSEFGSREASVPRPNSPDFWDQLKEEPIG